MFNVGKRRLRENIKSVLKYGGWGRGRGDILFQVSLGTWLDVIGLNCSKGDSCYTLTKAFGEQSKAVESFLWGNCRDSMIEVL